MNVKAMRLNFLSASLALLALTESRQSGTAFPYAFFEKPGADGDGQQRTIETVRDAIGESAHDAKLTLEANALAREAKVMQLKHQESLKGLQEACREQLAAQQKATLAQSSALSKATMHLNRLRTESDRIRKEAVSAEMQIREFQSSFQDFAEGVSTLGDHAASAVEGTNPRDFAELQLVLKGVSHSDNSAQSAARSRGHTAHRPPVAFQGHTAPHGAGFNRNASRNKAAPEHESKEQTAKHPRAFLLQDYAERMPDVLLRDSPLLAEAPVEAKLEEMKGKLVGIASASSRMQQNVVDHCSEEIAQGARSAAEMKQQANQAEAMQQDEEQLKKRLTAARQYLVSAHNTIQKQLFDFERDALQFSHEVASAEARRWATADPDSQHEGDAEADLSLLQVSSGAQQWAAESGRRAWRQWRSHQEPRFLLKDSGANFDSQEMQESTQGARRASVSGAGVSGSSMHAVAARVEELQARLSQMDMENKQSMDQARYAFERQLAEKQQQNRKLAKSNQRIAEDIQSLAKRRDVLRAEADRLRGQIPAWRSDLASLSTNFTTALEVTHKALANIDLHNQSPEIKILDDLDKEDQERMALETKRIKLQEIMAASEAQKREAAERDEAPIRPPIKAPYADGEADDEAQERDEGDATSSGVPGLSFLQTSMLNKIRRAAHSPNPSALLQALDTGLADLNVEHENAKEALRRKFAALISAETSRHEQLLDEQKALRAKLVSARQLDQRLQTAIRSLLDLDGQLRGQAQSLRAYTQQLGVRALPVAKHELISLESAGLEPRPEHQREPPEQVPEQPQASLMQRNRIVHTTSAKKAFAPGDGTEGLPSRDAKSSKHWLSWFTR